MIRFGPDLIFLNFLFSGYGGLPTCSKFDGATAVERNVVPARRFVLARCCRAAIAGLSLKVVSSRPKALGVFKLTVRVVATNGPTRTVSDYSSKLRGLGTLERFGVESLVTPATL